ARGDRPRRRCERRPRVASPGARSRGDRSRRPRRRGGRPATPRSRALRLRRSVFLVSATGQELNRSPADRPAEIGSLAHMNVASPAGLTSDQVSERIASGRGNDVASAPTRTVAQIIRSNLLTRFNALLGAMLAVILLVGQFRDALFGVVLVANTLIGTVQELRAKRTLDRLSVLTAPKAQALRDDHVREVAVSGVVLDDVLELAPGDQVVVDGAVLVSS